jgi:hypothetical protein
LECLREVVVALLFILPDLFQSSLNLLEAFNEFIENLSSRVVHTLSKLRA